MENEIRFMIADDHEMVRLGLRTYFMTEPDFVLLGEAENGEELLSMLEQTETERLPHVVLVDLMMPILDGVETTKRLSKKYPEIKVIVLTSFLEDEKVLAAIEAGAASYVLKTITSDDLAQKLRRAAQGVPIMDGEISQALTRGLRSRSARPDNEQFTQREKEVLLLIAEGKSNKEIGEELHISVKTVKTHVSNLLMKCELDDRTQLAIYAFRKGWVQSTKA
ncbi:MAG: DNA-binding response regulator [Paenibacillus sp. RIFOXYA1_FULL_44_5]|nr:MAG: DNA-binding response regulator [Paenibacillus sp. RIFOXYA1_FULL_44_5]